MNWFGGSIAEAVTYSQTQKALFFVAILGTDDASQTLERLLAEPDVVSFISDTSKFVCVRLSDGTEEHRQFLQLYTNAKSPSIYCISLKGVAIKIISNPADAAELRDQVGQAWARHQEVISQLGQAPATSTPPQATPAPLADAGASGSGAEASSPQPQPSLDERIERAKKLAAAKQQKRAAEEAEEQRRREKERREHGKGAAELKRWQEEEETKRLAEERRRDKKADALLKQKLREQIAQDRLDRQRRENPVETEVSAPSAPAQPPANFSGQARLQFRLPTGATRNQSFNPDSTLHDVRQYLITNAVVPFRDFTISVAFPRRQFTNEDYRATLRDLGLLPSAALLILPISSESMIHKAGSAGQGLLGFLTSIFGFMLYPVTLVFSFLQRAIAPAPALPPPRPGDRAAERSQTGRGNQLGGGSREATDRNAPSTSKAAKEANESAKKAKPSDHFGADGNVHRLRNGDGSDSDDEQATWNGNSTQQM